MQTTNKTKLYLRKGRYSTTRQETLKEAHQTRNSKIIRTVIENSKSVYLWSSLFSTTQAKTN